MTILLDTGFLYAFFNRSDRKHNLSIKSFSTILDGEYGKPIIIDYVFDELVTLSHARTKDNTWATFIGDYIFDLVNEDIFTFLHVSSQIFQDAWLIFRNQSGQRKFFSFTDCVILKTAKNLDIDHIASFDEHFKSYHKVIP